MYKKSFIAIYLDSNEEEKIEPIEAYSEEQARYLAQKQVPGIVLSLECAINAMRC